eukprot:13724974-Alexandrium_andersonii.AAC.1
MIRHLCCPLVRTPRCTSPRLGIRPPSAARSSVPLRDPSFSRIFRPPSSRSGMTEAAAPESTATCTRA